MKVTCISDLHGSYPKHLQGGDLLIVAGDLTAHDKTYEYVEFGDWMKKQKYLKKVVVCGNHDRHIERNPEWMQDLAHKNKFDYLCDSATEFMGFKIWGAPWTRSFKGINPFCKAFMLGTEEELVKKWELIPYDTDILVTHSPSFEWYDLDLNQYNKHVGSLSLAIGLRQLDVKLHVHGHIHEAYGHVEVDGKYTVNASYMNRMYQPTNDPINVEIKR